MAFLSFPVLRRFGYAVRSRTWRWLATGLLGASVCGQGVAAPSEAAVKAALIANFALYVEWPDAPAPSGRTRLCVAGSGSTIAALHALDGQTLFGRQVHILPVSRATEVNTCHILFIGNTSQKQPEDWVGDAADLPILTISEADNFVQHGGIVGLDRADNRVVFDVGLKAMRRSGIRINAALLRLARKVYAGG